MQQLKQTNMHLTIQQYKVKTSSKCSISGFFLNKPTLQMSCKLYFSYVNKKLHKTKGKTILKFMIMNKYFFPKRNT